MTQSWHKLLPLDLNISKFSVERQNKMRNENGSSSNLHILLKKTLPYPLYALLPLILVHLYFYETPFSFSQQAIISPSPPHQEVARKIVSQQTSCDYGDGEWVPDNSVPLYNGTTCGTIKQGQNCMASGRPDEGYLQWKWKPKHCELPRFEPGTFLKQLEGKHIAFVGDSLARNQLESLLCLMATASKPNLFYTDGEDNKFRKWHFPSHNANVSIYWSPFLVKGIEKTNEKNYNTLFLDSVDERWAGELGAVDILVLSVGHWYLHPAVYFYGNSVVGCHYHENCTETGFYDAFGRALKTAFEGLIQRRKRVNEKGMSVCLTTFSPAHFEGEWDKFGACSRTQPYNKSEQILDGMNAEMRKIGVEQVKEARYRANEEAGNRVRIEALDISELAWLRPDGHPGPYMNPFPFANGISEKVQNDCVHWCLPGPIDTWNQILLDIIKKSEFH